MNLSDLRPPKGATHAKIPYWGISFVSLIVCLLAAARWSCISE